MTEVIDPVEVCEGNTKLIQLFNAKLDKLKGYTERYQFERVTELLKEKVAPAQQRDLQALREKFDSGQVPVVASRQKPVRRSRGMNV